MAAVRARRRGGPTGARQPAVAGIAAPSPWPGWSSLPRGALLTRRAALLQALLGTATATGAVAGLSILTRGGPTARAVAPAGTPVAASAAVAAGSGLSVANPLGGSAALLVRSPDGTLAAYEAVCPHAGCKVGWTAGEIVCPCHHARFDPATGQPTRGPAQAPLEVVEVVERDGKVFLA